MRSTEASLCWSKSISAENDAEAILERLTARHRFNELLEMAKEICLTRSEEALAPEVVNTVACDRLGSFATNVALTFATMPFKNVFHPDRQQEAMDFLQNGAMLAHRSYDVKVSHDIAAFGRQYLQEIYAVLGSDADEKVAQYRNSLQTEDDDLGLFAWLTERCRDIDTCADELVASSAAYTPVDLSPKLLGQYPVMQAQPNCLSFDAMAIACLQKAGAEVYYSRFLKADSDIRFESVGFITHTLQKVMADIPHKLRFRMDMICQDIAYGAMCHLGFHAGLVVRTPSGMIYELDPRGNNVATVSDEQADELSERLAMLDARSKDAVIDEPSIFLYTTRLSRMRDLCWDSDWLREFVSIEDERDKLHDAIQRPGGIAYVIQRAIERLEASEFGEVMDSDLYDEMDRIMGRSETTHHVIERAIKKWLFDNLDESALQQLMATSELVKQEVFARIDAVMAVALTVASLHLAGSRVDVGDGVLPQEIGNAEYGVGVSVLHDISVQTGEYLPPDFWAAHWASVVPHIELAAAYNKGEIEMTDRQIASVRAALVWFGEVRLLPCLGYDGIIKEFLDHTQP